MLYDVNVKTLEVLNDNGYNIVSGEDLIEANQTLTKNSKTVIAVQGSEIVKALGGIRCLTHPLVRD